MASRARAGGVENALGIEIIRDGEFKHHRRRRALTRCATMTPSARWPARQLVDRRQQRAGQQLQGIRGVVEDTCRGHFNYGHAGPGSVSHLVPEVILDGSGMQAVPVNAVHRQGGGPAAQAVAGGFVSVVASSNARSPRPRSRASSSRRSWSPATKRSRRCPMPDVPSLNELGQFANVDLQFWWGLFVPKGTPEPIRAKLEEGALRTPCR